MALTLRLIARLAKTAKESPFPISYRKYISLPKTRLFEYAVEEFDLSMPRNVEEWIQFSEGYMAERGENDINFSLRPWMDREPVQYTKKAEKAVLALNKLFVGVKSNENAIDRSIDDLLTFASQGTCERLP